MKLSRILVLLFALTPFTAAWAQLPVNSADIYFLMLKADKNGIEKLDGIKNLTCQNFKTAYPQYKNLDEFITDKKCSVETDSTGNLTLLCPSTDDLYDKAVFTDEEFCVKTLVTLKSISNNPHLKNGLKNLPNAKWFTFDAYREKPMRMTKCVESALPPEGAMQNSECTLIFGNSTTQAFKCGEEQGVEHDKIFTLSKDFCELFKEKISK